jgi:alpha,alpha-trehalose-phosphate synthase [UDP-forming]
MTETLPWNKEKLYQLVRTKLGKNLLVVVSNREPYVHKVSGDRIKWEHPVSGLIEALDPVLRASGGTWIAQGASEADRQTVDASDRIAVPPDNPEYTLRRVWLTEEEMTGYYLGFSNEGLWPLCHTTFIPPVFNEAAWQTYKKVNRIFADVVIQEIGSRKAVVLVQDYHFALLSQYIKEQKPDLTIGQFWHIPWPSYEAFRTCPWNEEIISGLLGNDLLGFHTQSYCRNFIESVERSLEARVDLKKKAIIRQSHATFVEPFPISVDFDEISQQAGTEAVEREMENLRLEYDLEGKYIGIGMDRLDYTKGIPERLQALDKFLEDNPRYRGKVVYIQAGMPSRTEIDIYKQMSQRIDELISGINEKYGTAFWKPVIPMMRQVAPVTLNALRRLAHFCLVSSLHDGMNLVAKEYISARIDGDGVLILSRFTGAAEELADALLINPYVIGEFAEKIKEAIEMPEEERRRRMKNMRKTVATYNIYRWGASILSRLFSIAGVP